MATNNDASSLNQEPTANQEINQNSAGNTSNSPDAGVPLNNETNQSSNPAPSQVNITGQTPPNGNAQATSIANQQGATTFDTNPIGGEGDPGGFFERILWFSAGADATILDRCPRSDKVKYQGLGGIVLATGILAFIAMWFAIKTIFFDEKVVADLITNGKAYQAWLVPTLIGLIWGLIIFNLDRFIISSTGKGDGTDRITGSELINGLPRIFMALVIALSISAPLEITLFDEEITKIFKKENDKLMSEKERDYEQSAENDIQDVQDLINIKLNEKKEQDILYSTNQEKVQYEISNGGCKDKCNEFKALMQMAEKKSLGLQQEIDKLQLRIDDKNKANKERLDEIREAINSPPGLLDRLILLENLPDGQWPVWIVRLLFIVIEVGPIFFKMMITRGVYDHFKQNMDELRLAENDIFQDTRIQVGPNQVATVETFYQYGRPFIRQREAQLRVQEQQRINDEIIRQWQQYLAQQISNHPEQFVANSNPVSVDPAGETTAPVPTHPEPVPPLPEPVPPLPEPVPPLPEPVPTPPDNITIHERLDYPPINPNVFTDIP
jgi:hypothetical protein